MEDFKVEQLNENTYAIYDSSDDTFYLLLGKKSAAVIDTGMSPGKTILPVLRQLTELPLFLIVTHAHLDHLYHMDEFTTVYMNPKDKVMMTIDRQLVTGGKNSIDLTKTIAVQDGDTIALDDENLEIVEVGGHTPGSIAIYASNRKMLFTGDAIGSGCGVWMQIPGCLSLTEYLNSLHHFINYVASKKEDIQFFGGHNHQVTMSQKVPGYNPISLGLACDMADLVSQIITGKIIGEINNTFQRGKYDCRYGSYGRAEILYCQENIKKGEEK